MTALIRHFWRVTSLTYILAYYLLLLSELPLGVSAQPRTEQPTCYSTTDEYVNRNLIINVKPANDVLIQRLQGPELRIFCISFAEAGPQCSGTTSSVPTLCSRRVDQPSNAFTCEKLTAYAGDANANTVRGNINGPNMIWDIMWDITGKTPDCFPRSVEVRLLAFVRGAKVSSDAVFGILLAIVIITALVVMLAFFWFLRNRLQVVDKQGAITEGGPKADFRGPQMAMTAPIAIANNESKIFLPVREGAATNDMMSSRYGNLSSATGMSNTPATIRRGPGEGARPSPPRPGDGAPGGSAAFAGARRQTLFGPDGEEIYDGQYDIGGSSMRRRHRRRKSTDIRNDERGGPGGRSALFPTMFQDITREEDEHIYFDEEGRAIDPTRPQRSMGAGGPGITSPFGPDGSRTHGVKCIPQWMLGSFGKGGVIPEAGDGINDERYAAISGSESEHGTKYKGRRGGPVGSQTFGVYERRGLRERRTTNLVPAGSESDGGSRRGTPKRRNVGGSPLGSPKRRSADRRTASTKRRTQGGNFADDAYTGPRTYGDEPGAGPRRRSPFGGRGFRGEGETVEDNFERSNAKVFNPALRMEDDDFAPANRRFGDDPDLDKENAAAADPNKVSLKRQGGAAQCADCKTILGTGTTPKFCKATGQRHE